jgi:hypothetical protein
MHSGPASPKISRIENNNYLNNPSEKFGSMGIVDRELKSLKFRHTEFSGLRVPTQTLSMNNPSSTLT